MTTWTRRMAIALLAVLAAAPLAAPAQTDATAPAVAEAAAPAKGTADAKAQEILRATANYYAGLTSASASTIFIIENRTPMNNMKVETGLEIAMARPNQFRLQVKGENGLEFTLGSDGKTFYNLPPVELGGWVSFPAPAKMDDVLTGEKADGELMFLGPERLLTYLFHSDPYTQILERTTRTVYAGLEGEGPTAKHKLVLSTEDYDATMLIAQGDRPTVDRISFNLDRLVRRELAGAQLPFPVEQIKVTADLIVKEWKTGEAVDAAQFAFTEPTDRGTKLDSLKAVLQQDWGASKGEPAEALVGKPAADFELVDMDGKIVKLSSFKGQKVVILDFWATWCPPCVEALPILTKVTAEFADEGVVLLGVNQQEDTATIKEFLDRTKLSFPIVLDVEGKVARDYMLQGLPQTVIVDRDGVVRIVHMGLSPTLEADLRKELAEILAAKPATEAPAAPAATTP